MASGGCLSCLGKKDRKEAELRVAFYKDAPLNNPPPNTSRRSANTREAGMYRFPPIRPQKNETVFRIRDILLFKKADCHVAQLPRNDILLL